MTPREEFTNETGMNWENSQGEPDIDYVLWIEQKLEEAEADKDAALKALDKINSDMRKMAERLNLLR